MFSLVRVRELIQCFEVRFEIKGLHPSSLPLHPLSEGSILNVTSGFLDVHTHTCAYYASQRLGFWVPLASSSESALRGVSTLYPYRIHATIRPAVRGLGETSPVHAVSHPPSPLCNCKLRVSLWGGGVEAVRVFDIRSQRVLFEVKSSETIHEMWSRLRFTPCDV